MFIELNTGELLLFDVFIIMKVRMFMQQRGTIRPIKTGVRHYITLKRRNFSNSSMRMVVQTAWIQFQKQKKFDLDI